MPDHRSGADRASVPGVLAGRTPDRLRSGNHGLTPAQVAASQRARVLAALRALLAERSLREIPVADVIARAGVSRKTFYELYANKEECFVAVYEREVERVVDATLRAFAGEEPWADRLRTALGVLLGALAADPAAARICFLEVTAAGPDALARRHEAMAAFEPLFAVEHARAPADGPPPRSIVAASIGHLSEVLGREIAAGRTAELPGLRGDLMYTLTLPFTGPAEAGRELARGPGGAPAQTAEDAGERGFLARYGAVAADLLGRVDAAMAGALAAAEAPGAHAADVADAPAPAARIRAGVGAVLDFCAAEPAAARACLVEALSVGPEARARRTATLDRLTDMLELPLRELRPSERIARVSAVALVGGLTELIFDPVDRGAVADLPSLDTVLMAARLEAEDG